MTINTVNVVGHLVRDVEKKVTPSGVTVATFAAATNHRYRNAGGEWKEETAFISGVAFGHTAESLACHRKGTMVVLAGRLRTESWESDGTNRSRLVLVAEKAEAVQRLGSPDGASGRLPLGEAVVKGAASTGGNHSSAGAPPF